MIQRIQTVFLALVVLLGVAASFLSIMTFTGGEGSYIMNLYKTVIGSNESGEFLTKNMGVGALFFGSLALCLFIGLCIEIQERFLR